MSWVNNKSDFIIMLLTTVIVGVGLVYFIKYKTQYRYTIHTEELNTVYRTDQITIKNSCVIFKNYNHDTITICGNFTIKNN